MSNWLRDLLICPHVVVFAGITLTLIAEVIRYAGSKKENTTIEYVGLSVLISGLLISGAGGYWAAKEQSHFEQRILGSVTGGDSYSYIMPLVDQSSGWTTFMLMHDGDYPVYDISVTILDLTKMETLPFDKVFPKGDMIKEDWEALMMKRDLLGEFLRLREKATFRLELSILTPGTAHQFARFQLPKENDEQRYLVSIFSRGGKFNQTLIHRRINGQWRNSMRISRDSGSDNKSIVLQEIIHPEIPINDK